MPRTKREIDVKHEACKVSFAAISSERIFFESNQKILDWISSENPRDVHRSIRNQTRVDDLYASCGEWLVSSDQFGEWNKSDGTEVFWLCGSGTFYTLVLYRI
jgi:hypothetical protein